DYRDHVAEPPHDAVACVAGRPDHAGAQHFPADGRGRGAVPDRAGGRRPGVAGAGGCRPGCRRGLRAGPGLDFDCPPRHRGAVAAMPIGARRQATLRFSAGLIGYVVATIVAALGLPGVALGIYGLIAVYYLFEHLPEVAGDSAADEDAPPAGQAAT